MEKTDIKKYADKAKKVILELRVATPNIDDSVGALVELKDLKELATVPKDFVLNNLYNIVMAKIKELK